MKKKIFSKKEISSLFFIIFAIILVSCLIFNSYIIIQSKIRYIKINGTVVETKKESVSDINYSRYCRVKYKYEIDGVSYANFDKFESYSKCPQIGEHKVLYYNPNNPNYITVKIDISTAVFYVILSTFLLIGTIILSTNLIEKYKLKKNNVCCK